MGAYADNDQGFALDFGTSSLEPVLHLMLEEHDAADNVHRMIDQKVHHVGVKRVAAHTRHTRQAYQRIGQINERGLNPRQFVVVIGDNERSNAA
jgi:hypothetical protein